MFHCIYSLFTKVALLIQYYFLKWKAPDTIVFLLVVIIVDLEIALTMFSDCFKYFHIKVIMFVQLWMEQFIVCFLFFLIL